MRRRFELIVFDWDGTLADSTGLIVAGMQRAIGALGLEPRADESIRALIGIGFREALAELYPEHDAAELEAALMALRRRAGVDCAPRPTTRSDTPRRAAPCIPRRRKGPCPFHGAVEHTGSSLATCVLPPGLGAQCCRTHTRDLVAGLSSTQLGLITHAQTIVMPYHDVDTGRWTAAVVSRHATKTWSNGHIEVVWSSAAP